VEEAGVHGENHRPWASNWYTLSLAAAKTTEETPENKPMNYVLYEKRGSISMTTSKFSIFIKLIPFLFKAKVD